MTVLVSGCSLSTGVGLTEAVDGDYPDCTHYCVTPMMYQPIFYELSLAAKKIK